MSQDRASARTRRVRGTRERTEQEIADAALRLLDRDGVLAGLALRTVAAVACVNYGQIYQYFGSRRNLLRAAIRRRLAAEHDALDAEHWRQPFAGRSARLWRWSTQRADQVKLSALLALDDDPEFRVFPDLDRSRAADARGQAGGELPLDTDVDALRAVTTASYLGYAVFRDAMARELGTSVRELDDRTARVFADAFTSPPTRPISDPTPPSPRSTSASERDTGRGAQRARTRRAIVEAGRRLATSEVPVRVGDIATEAGVSEATVYRYFSDVGAVLFESMLGLWPGAAGALAAVPAGAAVAERVEAAVTVYVSHIVAHQAAIRATASSAVAARSPARSEIRFELFHLALAPAYEQSRPERPEFRAMRDDLAALTSASAIFGVIDRDRRRSDQVVTAVASAAATLTRARLA